MSPEQERQKDEARKMAIKHLEYSAVDRQRDEILDKYNREDAISEREMRSNARKVRDVNGYSAGD
jgi:hypothetical protein